MYALPDAGTRRTGTTMINTKVDPYKVDEGYSEGTRSQDGSDSPMRLDLPRALERQLPTSFAPQLGELVAGLTEDERSELAYDLLRGLRASSISNVFDRLWPQFHKDPLLTLPPELMSLILSYLDPHDLLTTSLVSRAWRDRVTDSNLWKTKFSVEGWALDGDQIAEFERTFQHMNSPHKIQTTKQANMGDSPTMAFDSSPSWSGAFGSRSAGKRRETTEAPVFQPQAGEDEEMTDVGSEPIRPGVMDALPNASQRSLDRMHTTPPASSHGRPYRPLVITSPPGYSRLNYHYIYKQKRRLEDNWDKGLCKNFQLPHRNAPQEAHAECVYTIQYQGDYLVSGSRDRTVRIWNLNTGRLMRKPLRGHTGSVLCLQFDARPEEDIIISGSSDTNVILWRFSTGELIKKLSEAHKESVLNLRFDQRYLVTCSKDKTIKIWNRHSLRPGHPDYPVKGRPGGGDCPAYIIDPSNNAGSPRYQPSNPSHLMELEPYMLLMTLDLHSAAVNAIQIWEDQLVSASGDRSLRVWDIHTGECLSKLPAHEKGIACVQYDGKRIVSGSSDCSIRIWDPATKTEVARLEGHTRLVRTLQAAFADVPGGREKLENEAAEIDREWIRAQKNGDDLRGHAGRSARPGSRKPRDLRALGAKIPPSGGGSRWARIVSGSYDEKVIIWKKNASDEWVISHQLAQEEALTAAGPPLGNRTLAPQGLHQDDHAPSTSLPAPSLPSQRIAGPTMPPNTHPPLALNPPAFIPGPTAPNHQTRASYPETQQMLESERHVGSNDDVTSFTAAQKSPSGTPPASSSASRTPQDPSQRAPRPLPPNVQQLLAPRPASTTTQVQNRPNLPQANATTQQVGQPNARVFKLQFDARRIVCCSQDNKIVGWDFANGDEDIITCARFFADPQ